MRAAPRLDLGQVEVHRPRSLRPNHLTTLRGGGHRGQAKSLTDPDIPGTAGAAIPALSRTVRIAAGRPHPPDRSEQDDAQGMGIIHLLVPNPRPHLAHLPAHGGGNEDPEDLRPPRHPAERESGHRAER